jgi:hypothetical protein
MNEDDPFSLKPIRHELCKECSSPPHYMMRPKMCYTITCKCISNMIQENEKILDQSRMRIAEALLITKTR